MRPILFLVLICSLLIFQSAFAQLSDRTGLKQVFVIETGGYEFPVEVVSNFNVDRTEFSAEEKKLTLFISSDTENNLAELQIPINLINGEFTFFVNDQEIIPTIQSSEDISFIFLEFEGDGSSKIEIIGTTYLPEFAQVASLILAGSIGSIIILNRFTNYSFKKVWILASIFPVWPKETSLSIPFLSTSIVDGVPWRENPSKVSAEYSFEPKYCFTRSKIDFL